MIFIKTMKNTFKIWNIIYQPFLMIQLLTYLVVKKLNLAVTKLFIRGRKLNISLAFMTQSYFAVRKNIRLNSTHYLLWKFQLRITSTNYI